MKALPHEHNHARLAGRLPRQLPDKAQFSAASEAFKLLDDPNRLLLFWVLCHVEECVINLAAILDTSSPNLSHHLRILKGAGLITSRRDGKEVYYKASDSDKVLALHTALEQIMEISCPERQTQACQETLTSQHPRTEVERTVEQVHAYLASNLDKRITIEELAHRFLINATTLKEGFKRLYGTSIAAHIKEHRLEKAAGLLTETDQPVSEIAKAVGYVNQSKFSSAFFEKYRFQPLEFRRRHSHQG